MGSSWGLILPLFLLDRRSYILLELPRVKDGGFLRELRESRHQYRPIIIILIEPKISGIESDVICK